MDSGLARFGRSFLRMASGSDSSRARSWKQFRCRALGSFRPRDYVERILHAYSSENCRNWDTVGRGMEVSKEEIVGMAAAVDWFLSQTDEGIQAEFRKRADRIAAQLKSIPTMESRIVIPNVATNSVPHLLLRYDRQRARID